MSDYDSDSSGAGEIQTNVLLGYASKEPTGDDFSQLGGYPIWMNESKKPSGTLAKCKSCNGLLNLLLQLNADLPDKLPGVERKLYILACKRKACRRKNGSVRGIRATRRTAVDQSVGVAMEIETVPESSKPTQTPTNLGETLFGVKPMTSNQVNPFAASSNGATTSNPFAAASSLAAKPPQRPEDVPSLTETFAQKARISAPEAATPLPYEPWPDQTAFPEAYPAYYLDAEKEYIDPEPQSIPSGVRMEPATTEGEGSSILDDKAAFESSMDKTFQKFADRLVQNPEQVLRYEHAGQPLLYSSTDAIGKLLSSAQEKAGSSSKVKTNPSAANGGGLKIPRCANCGAERVFELQLTPRAIYELEVDEMSVDGMDWGTIIMAVCARDCAEKGKSEVGEVGYVEEWIGVQWEEIVRHQ